MTETEYKLVRRVFVEGEVQAIPRIAHVLSARTQTRKFGTGANAHYGTAIAVVYLAEIEPKKEVKNDEK